MGCGLMHCHTLSHSYTTCIYRLGIYAHCRQYVHNDMYIISMSVLVYNYIATLILCDNFEV